MNAEKQALARLLDLGAEALPDASELQTLGFQEPKRFLDGMARLHARADLSKLIDLHRGSLIAALSKSCDPDQAFSGLEAWLEAGGATVQQDDFSGPQTAWTEPEFLTTLCRLFAATPALTQYFIRHTRRTNATLLPVIQRRVYGGAEWHHNVGAAMTSAPTYQQQLAALRHVRYESMLRIAALDLMGISKLEDTVRALSDLADACIDAAIWIGAHRLYARFGWPNPNPATMQAYPAPLPFFVVGMGKLGGQELNYSSDIDLVFVYSRETEFNSAVGNVAYRAYFKHLAEEIIAALDQVTTDGRVYRVDMRLRPYGRVGALAMSIPHTLSYLETEGRTWERQAWLKARIVGGDRTLGAQLLKVAQTFIYRKHLTFDAIQDIKSLKRQIELDVNRRGEGQDEIKLGRGGIRDIEFTVQFLQLLHGSNLPSVRTTRTLDALQRLKRESLLRHEEADTLERAYIYFRHIEHRLQLYGEQQTHKLPADPRARRRLARSMYKFDFVAPDGAKISAEQAFEAERQHYVEAVRTIFERLFANLFSEQQGPDANLTELLLAPEPDYKQIAALLPNYGFQAREENARELIELRREGLLLMNPSRTRKFFASLAPLLLRALAVTGEPEGALHRFSRIASSIGGKAVFYQALHENLWLLRMVADLSAGSEYLTNILVSNPGMFDELVDYLSTDRSKSLEEMEKELTKITQGGAIAATLRAYRNGETLRIGVRDLLHSVPLEQTQHELSDLACAILRTQLRHTQLHMQEEKGFPLNEQQKPIGFAVIALGKFAGGEMNYASDLDVLFFYGEAGQTAQGLPAATYFTYLARELMQQLEERTNLGQLYHIDARLRPNGNKGPLAIEMAAFEKYWKDGSLADWERLALTRAKFAAGDASIGERAEHLIRSAVYTPRPGNDLSENITEMRRRIEESAESGDIKKGAGGLVDVEFLVQYLQLRHGPAYPRLRQTNTTESLKILMRYQKLPEEEGLFLLKAYDLLSMIANRIRIVHGLDGTRLPSEGAELDKLAKRMGYVDAPDRTAGVQLMLDYQRQTERVREIFDAQVKG